jgi:hypothetical protein
MQNAIEARKRQDEFEEFALAAEGFGTVSFIADSVGSLRSILSWLRHSAAWLQGPILVALIYFLAAEAAFYIGTLSDRIFALFWPPNVVLFCALLIVPQRQWGLYIAAAFPAHILAELAGGLFGASQLVDQGTGQKHRN